MRDEETTLVICNDAGILEGLSFFEDALTRGGIRRVEDALTRGLRRVEDVHGCGWGFGEAFLVADLAAVIAAKARMAVMAGA